MMKSKFVQFFLIKIVSGILNPILFILLGFYILNNKVEGASNPMLIKSLAILLIVFFAIVAVFGVIRIFKSNSN